MMSTTITEQAFKSFEISGLDQRSVFRILEIEGEVTQAQVQSLFEQLPIEFRVQLNTSQATGRSNDSIFVKVSEGIIKIFPPIGSIIPIFRLIDNVAARKMRVTELVNTFHPGKFSI